MNKFRNVFETHNKNNHVRKCCDKCLLTYWVTNCTSCYSQLRITTRFERECPMFLAATYEQTFPSSPPNSSSDQSAVSGEFDVINLDLICLSSAPLQSYSWLCWLIPQFGNIQFSAVSRAWWRDWEDKQVSSNLNVKLSDKYSLRVIIFGLECWS